MPIPISRKVIPTIFLFSFFYAVIRYNIAGNVSWSHLPLYVFNKTVALSAIILFSYISIFSARRHSKDRERCRLALGILILMHTLISLILLSPDYYSKLFDKGKMNFSGELAMLFGALSFTALVAVYIRQKREIETPYIQLKRVILLAAGGHLLFIGFSSWITPVQWYGHLPPISLIAFLVLLAATIAKRKKIRNASFCRR